MAHGCFCWLLRSLFQRIIRVCIGHSLAARPPGQRCKHIAAIAKDGRLKWQAATGYGKRAVIETAIGRYKASIGRRLRARSFPAQQTEVAIGCAVLNRMLAYGRPESVRHHEKQA
jgi:hypothetical protein